LTGALNAVLPRGAGPGWWDRGTVLVCLATAIVLGATSMSDIGLLAHQALVFGGPPSEATVRRALAGLDEAALRQIAKARAKVRARVWDLLARRPQGFPWLCVAGKLLSGWGVIDLDATLITAHSDKQGAEGTYKHGFGFHPLGAWLDRGDGTGEPLAAILRPGNAGAHTAADHIQVLDLALAQLPRAARETQPILVRADSAGATHAFLAHLRHQGIRFWVGFDLDHRVREAILALPADAWLPAADADGQPRDGAQVAQLACLDLAAAGWPTGTRAICRRERPHPGAQLTFTDADGWRFQVFITDQSDPNIALLELRHRQHARVEDRIRAAKATGARNLPFDLWRRNAVWLELVLLALDLVAWAQTLLLDGDLAVAEPKTLRYRLWHVAGKLTRHARRVRLRLQRTWPWAGELVAAFTRLRALPLPG
jgi:hypothetical protein